MENIFLPNNNGFLAQEYINIINKIKTTYKDWFLLIEEVNKLVYDMYNDISVKNDDEIGLYLVTSFCKVHKSFQSCSILYSYGLEDEVLIIFRIMLESLFIASSIKIDNSNFDKLIKNQDIEDTQKLNDLIDRGAISNIEKMKINYRDKTSMWEFAQLGKYENMFIAYSYLSSYTHIDLKTLEKNYDIKNGEITSICIAPSVNDICFILTEIIGLMLSYIDLILDYSKKDYTTKLKTLKDFHIYLQKKSK